MSDIKWNPSLWEGVTRYCNAVEKSITCWHHFMAKEFTSDYFTKEEVLAWLDRAKCTISTLHDLYLYDAQTSFAFHPLGSGFPERTHVQILESFALKVRNQVPRHVGEQELKRAFLDHLFSEKLVSHSILREIATVRAEQVLSTHDPLKQFAVRYLHRLDVVNGNPSYACCFERYCYTHRPSLYVVVFEYSGGHELTEEEIEEIAYVMREETSRMPKLGHFAQQLDQACALIHPKWIGRISLGPVFMSHHTEDEHQLQVVLNELGTKRDLRVASRIIYEYVLAESESEVQRLSDPKGRRHTVLQQYAVRQLNDACADRLVSYVEKHLFTSHAVAQRLPHGFCSETGHVLWTPEEML